MLATGAALAAVAAMPAPPSRNRPATCHLRSRSRSLLQALSTRTAALSTKGAAVTNPVCRLVRRPSSLTARGSHSEVL